MGGFFGIFGDKDDRDTTTKNEKVTDDATLRLREEELDINKNRVQTGEVTLSKEIIEEQKRVDVPVTHEEVVIERRSLDNEPCDSPITSEETIRIPVSEEKVEVGKHTVLKGEVSAHKHEVEETETVDETVKREEARINTNGNPNVIDHSDR